METQKIVNLLGHANNESSKLQQENHTLSIIKIIQTKVKETKIVQPLNLKPKSLYDALFRRIYYYNREYNGRRW